MIGHYDPATLDIGEAGARIEFVGLEASQATNGPEIVDIDTPEKARNAAAALRHQADFGIADLDGQIRPVRGEVKIAPDRRQGYVIPEGMTRDHAIPFLSNFGEIEESVPQTGTAMIFGRPDMDIMMLERIAMISPVDLEARVSRNVSELEISDPGT